MFDLFVEISMNNSISDFKNLICCYFNKSVATNLNFLIFFATNFHLIIVY